MLLKLQTYGGITDARRLKFLVSTSKSESKSREKPSWPKSSSNQRWQVKSHSHGYFNGKIIGHGFQHVFHYQRLLSFTFHHHCEMQFIFLTKMLTHTHTENSDIYWHMVSPILWNIFHGNLLTFSGTYCSGKYVDINSDIKFRDGSGKFHVKFISYVATGILI